MFINIISVIPKNNDCSPVSSYTGVRLQAFCINFPLLSSFRFCNVESWLRLGKITLTYVIISPHTPQA